MQVSATHDVVEIAGTRQLKAFMRFGAIQCNGGKSHFESGALNRALPPLRVDLVYTQLEESGSGAGLRFPVKPRAEKYLPTH